MIRFTIPGKPQGKGRPRFSRRSGRTYTDEKTVAYEKVVAAAARTAMADLTPFVGPVEVHMTVRLQPAVSHSKKVRAAMLSGETPPITRYDLDNFIKSVSDGMNAIVYVDDCQITRLVCEKIYAEDAGVEVAIFPLSGSEPRPV